MTSTQPPEPTIRLLAALDWWIDLLVAVADRMGRYLHEQASLHSLLDNRPRDELVQYFGIDEVDQMISDREDRDTYYRKLEADALFIAGALYQVDAYLKRLTSTDTWQGSLASAGNLFRQIYKNERLRDLRNMIEHTDEHIAFDKSHIARDFDMGLGLKAWGVAGGRGIGVDTMYLFGNAYRILPAVEAAVSLQPHIQYTIPESMQRQDPPWSDEPDV